MTKQTWTVDATDVGLRLDKFLAAPDRAGSRLGATAALERGKVSVNGSDVGIEGAARCLELHDVITFWPDRPGTARKQPRTGRRGALDVLYEDDLLLVVNKPAGMLSVPLVRRGGGHSVYDHIADRLRSHGKRRPFVVHRIDEDTSGAVVFAMDAATRRALQDQFRRREPERVYQAIVYGHVRPAAGTWRDHLVWDDKALIQKAASARDRRAREAISEYRVIEEFEHASLIEVRLHSGRRNQIRVQAQLRGHPLVGEARYVGGAPHPRIRFGRQALHAARLEFDHPANGRRLSLEAPLPGDMRELLERLRRASASSRHVSANRTRSRP